MRTLKQIKNKTGAVALESVIAITLILPILFSFAFGGYNFYLRQADNINLNFEAGRFFSTLSACNEATLRSISSLAKFQQYVLITQINGVRRITHSPSNDLGTISISCNSATWASREIFHVFTSIRVGVMHFPPIFPSLVTRGGFYVVE